MGDVVPTVEREAQDPGEVAEGKAGHTAGEKVQESLHCLRGGQREGTEAPRGPGEAGGYKEDGSAAEQVWGWGEGSSCGSQAGRQDSGAARGPELSVLLEAEKTSEAGSGTPGDRSAQAKERQESEEQEVNRRETQRTWEQEEEEEARPGEPGMARGVESELPWHREPKEKAGADREEEVAGLCAETWLEVGEAVAEAEVSGTQAPWKIAGEVVDVRTGQGTGAQGTQDPGPESNDGITLHKEAWATVGKEVDGTASEIEEDSTSSGREEPELSGVRETEDGLVPGDRLSEATSRIRVPEEAFNREQEEELDEERENEVQAFPKQPWALVTEAIEDAAEGQKAEMEAAAAPEPEVEAGELWEAQTDQCCKEAQSEQSSEIEADDTRLQEAPAEEPPEKKKRCWAPEAELALNREAEGEADSEAALEARPEEECMGVQGQEDPTSQETLRVEWGVPEDQRPDLVGDAQEPAGPQKGQGFQEEHRPVLGLSKEETEAGLAQQPRHVGPVPFKVLEVADWKIWRGGPDSETTQGDKADVGEETAGGQTLEAEPKGGWESERPEVMVCGVEEGEAPVVENQELPAGTGLVLGESKVGETEDSVVGVTVPWEADSSHREGGRLEEAELRLQDREAAQTSLLATEVVEAQVILAEEGQEGEAGAAWGGEAGRGWAYSEERGEAGGAAVLVEAAQVLSEDETGGWHRRGQGGDSDKQHGDRHPEGEAQSSLDVDDVVVTGDQCTEAEGTALEALEDIQGLEGRPTLQPPVEMAPGETAEVLGSDPVDAHSSWSEALLPGSRLDVSALRDRALLQRSSWKRRSRPSSWRTPSAEQQEDPPRAPPEEVMCIPEQQEDPPSPPPEEVLSTPEPGSLQLEEAPEPSPSQSGGAPEPVKKKFLGQGFGLAHPGMMQELQARLVQRKPQ